MIKLALYVQQGIIFIMARALRIEFEGAIYHITSRGNERSPIFRDAYDRHRFLTKLGENVETHGIRVYAYVLMNNHYHLMLETPRANLSAFMQQFNTSYTVYYNHRHQRRGHLFEGRYKAKVVDGDRYLLTLARYIHLNPVKIQDCSGLTIAGKRTRLRGFKWSSYCAYIGEAKYEKFVDYEPLLSLVSADDGHSEQLFQEYVEGGLARDDAELRDALGRSSKAIGREEFCRRMEAEYGKRVEQSGQKLDASMRRIEVGVAPELVVDTVCSHFGVSEESLKKRRNVHLSRVVLMKLLKECSGLNHRSIASMLGVVDGSGISRGISRLNVLLEEDGESRGRYEMLKQQIINH